MLIARTLSIPIAERWCAVDEDTFFIFYLIKNHLSQVLFLIIIRLLCTIRFSFCLYARNNERYHIISPLWMVSFNINEKSRFFSSLWFRLLYYICSNADANKRISGYNNDRHENLLKITSATQPYTHSIHKRTTLLFSVFQHMSRFIFTHPNTYPFRFCVCSV